MLGRLGLFHYFPFGYECSRCDLLEYYLYWRPYGDFICRVTWKVGIEINSWIFVEGYQHQIKGLIWHHFGKSTILYDHICQYVTSAASIFPFQFI